MENFDYVAFLDLWTNIMWVSCGVSVLISAIIFIAYRIKYSSLKTYKEKFDLASTSETNIYLKTQYAIAVAVFFAANTAYNTTVELSPIWLFIRLFISFCLGTLHTYVAFLIFKYYYPGPLSKKLEKLRYTPRINPATGNKMKLLSEEEEDAYLDEGMQAEENVFSVDYDVWIDPKTKDTVIEKYQGHLSALECDRCGFQTLRLAKEEIIREPAEDRDGELLKEYNCSYCGRIKRKTVKLTASIKDSSILAAVDHRAADKDIKFFRVEIHGETGETKTFDFQNRNQAKQFLEEFNFAKLQEEQD